MRLTHKKETQIATAKSLMSLAISKSLTKDGGKSTELSQMLVNTYSPKTFCETYNPDLQSHLMVVISIAELSTIDGCPMLGDVGLAYGIEGARAWLKCHLIKVNGFVVAKQKLTNEQLLDLSDQIVCEYPYLNIAELCCFFGRLRSGKYEEFFGSVDPVQILKSLNTFCQDRRKDILKAEQAFEAMQMESRIKERASHSITLEQYLKNRNGMMRVTIYWVTKDPDKIARIRERFGIPNYVSVNTETPAEIKDEDIELLRETEKRGFIQLRFKPE